MEKTNALRLLDARGVQYAVHEYDPALTDGQAVADAVGKPRDETFKTLVAVGASGRPHVFAIPVNCSLDLKKAARAAVEKSVAMLPQKELFALTGYVHGGCSPIGMKKQFKTTAHLTAEIGETIMFSAGKVGRQVIMKTEDFIKAVPGIAFADLIKE